MEDSSCEESVQSIIVRSWICICPRDLKTCSRRIFRRCQSNTGKQNIYGFGIQFHIITLFCVKSYKCTNYTFPIYMHVYVYIYIYIHIYSYVIYNNIKRKSAQQYMFIVLYNIYVYIYVMYIFQNFLYLKTWGL